jgi:hypothetical protein
MKKNSVIGKYIWLLLFLFAGFTLCKCTSRCCGGSEVNDTIRVDSIVKHDTIFVEFRDTLPAEKGETVIKYVTIPCKQDTVNNKNDSVRSDSLRVAVVQKKFSDDSTYTAYVSGLKYKELPKLDSITVRQRDIINTIVKTITIKEKRSRWSIGLHGGYGLCLQSRSFEPYVGFGINYALFPP